MVDKKSLKTDPEEYRLQEDEEESHDYGVGSIGNEDSSSSKFKNLRGKRLLMPIILIVAVTLVYQFLSWYSNRKEESGVKQEEAVAQKSAQNLTTVRQNDLGAVEKQSNAVKDVGDKAVVDEDADIISAQQKLDILAMRTESNTAQLGKLKDNLGQVDTTLTSLNQSVGALSKSVQELSSNVQTLVQAQKEKASRLAKAPVKVVKRKVAQRDVAPRLIYHLKAIVPGLAWLEGSDGRTMAVRVGDRLGGYGVVRLIAPKQGMVITSSGTVIQYGMNDF